MVTRAEVTTAELYPEEYIIEEDLAEMGDTRAHTDAADNIKDVLEWRFRDEGWLIVKNMNVYHPLINNSQHYCVPDDTLIKIRLPDEEGRDVTSWDALRQAPAVVFEVSSEGTWPHDVRDGPNDKPAIYGRIGIKEYFAYDPQHPPVWRPLQNVRLRGWRYSAAGQPIELARDEQGRLRSEELDCYLVEDNYYLGFVNAAGERYLTAREAAQQSQAQAEARERASQRTFTEREAQLLDELRAERQARIQAETQLLNILQAEREARIKAEAREQAEREARMQLEIQLQQMIPLLQTTQARLEAIQQDQIERLETQNSRLQTQDEVQQELERKIEELTRRLDKLS